MVSYALNYHQSGDFLRLHYNLHVRLKRVKVSHKNCFLPFPCSMPVRFVLFLQVPDCGDQIDCTVFGKDYACRGEFVPWAKINCPVYCGLCPGKANQPTLVLLNACDNIFSAYTVVIFTYYVSITEPSPSKTDIIFALIW